MASAAEHASYSPLLRLQALSGLATPLPVAAVKALFEDLLRGLDACHARGVLHRVRRQRMRGHALMLSSAPSAPCAGRQASKFACRPRRAAEAC